MRYLIVLMLVMFVGCGKKTEVVEGVPGKDGASCYSEQMNDGVIITCGDDEHFVSNGQDGQDGVDGQDGTDGADGSFEGYLELVEVCPQINGTHKETLLMLDGTYLAFLVNANYKKERLVKLQENIIYSTTDGRNVQFSIVSGQIVCL